MSTELAVTGEVFDNGKLELLKRTICRGATDDEFELFVHACKRTGLDPFMRQIHAVKRSQYIDGGYKDVMTIQTGIDGYRLIAERTDRYMPGREPTFEYDADKYLIKATAYVMKLDKLGKWHEIGASAHFTEYAGYKRDGGLTNMWKDKPHIMLGKCAEALALRRCFPAELSGIYTREEMEQADNHAEPATNAKSTSKQEQKSAAETATVVTSAATAEQVLELSKLVKEADVSGETVANWLTAAKSAGIEDMTFDAVSKCILYCQKKIKKMKEDAVKAKREDGTKQEGNA